MPKEELTIKVINNYHEVSTTANGEFHDRFKSLLDGMTYSAFARKTQLSDKSIRDYANGKTLPNILKVKQIADVMECSVIWLAYGIGPKDPTLANTIGMSACEPNGYSVAATYGLPKPSIGISDVIELTDAIITEKIAHLKKSHSMANASHVYASTLADNLYGQSPAVNLPDMGLRVPFHLSFIQNILGKQPHHLSVFKVTSDSMSPIINPMDIVLIEHEMQMPSEGLHLVYINGAASIQHIQYMIDNKLSLSTSNPAFSVQEVDTLNYPKGFNILGKVIWAGKLI